ncbi:helix-turn-helix domain-containing protein, partial [Alkalihalophilus pseudofirmus]|uniref:helix-turn-helix domain-containing protein n=3 Tax=Alkalihalophilus pseudofirmus TaxID=79885 RepID=UPI000AC5080B
FMSKRAFTPTFKLEVLKACEDGFYTLSEIMKKYKVSKSAIKDWKYKFDTYGTAGLQESSTCKSYTKELKLSAVRDCLSGQCSINEAVKKYEVSSTSVLRKWIKKYNSHSEFKDTAKGRSNTMTKRKKTNWEERIHIARHCLENAKDYQQAANTYDVSYQQVYQWVKKYESGGDEALKDKRGKKKEEAQLTPEAQLDLQMKKLERENERLRAENLFLKKLEEVERRRR